MDNLQLWYIIFKLCDFKEKLAIVLTCKVFKNNFYINDLCRIDNKYINVLNDNILKSDIFQNTYALCTVFNKNITNISFLTNLKELNASSECNISQNSVDKLHLTKLRIWSNNKITNISFMKSLKELDISNCNISQKDIVRLDLVAFCSSFNHRINNVSFMTNLKKLNISRMISMRQTGIAGLNLYELNITSNPIIRDISFMKNLVVIPRTMAAKTHLADKLVPGRGCGVYLTWANGIDFVPTMVA